MRRNDNIGVQSLIRFDSTDAGAKLTRSNEHILHSPVPLGRASWPAYASVMYAVHEADNEDYLEAKEISREAAEEILAIKEILDQVGNDPGLSDWQNTGMEELNEFWGAVNQQAAAMNIWERIAVPYRVRNDIVYRVGVSRGTY